MQRRSFIQTMSATLAATALGQSAFAQTAYPSKAIRIVVPTSPGGATDAVARLFAEQAGQVLKRPVIIDNVPGAATLLAVRQVVKAPPDGYTLSVMANSFTAMPYVDKNAGYRTTDLKGISYLARSNMFLVVAANAPYASLLDVVKAAKSSPGALSYATVGEGTTSHIPVEMFSKSAGIELTQVPYKGITTAIPDVISSRVNLMMGTKASVGALIQSGKLKALAVASEARIPTMPDVPTFAELGFNDVHYELYLGLMAPAHVPSDVLQQLSAVFEAIKSDPAVTKRLALLDQELPTQKSAEQFNAFLQTDEIRMHALLQRQKT